MTNFTIKWLTVIFDRLSGLISRIILSYTMQLRQHVRDSLEWVKTLEKSTLCCVTAEIDPIYQHLVGAKHRTKYIKNILGQPVHTKELIYVQLHN